MTRLPGIPVLVFALTVTTALLIVAECVRPYWIGWGLQTVWNLVLVMQIARGRYGRDKSLRDFFS